MTQSVHVNKKNLQILKNISLHDADIKTFSYDFKEKRLTIELTLEWPGKLIEEAKNACLVLEDIAQLLNSSYDPWAGGEGWIHGLYVREDIEESIQSAKRRILPDTLERSTDWLDVNDFYAARDQYFKISIEYHSGDITEIITNTVTYTEFTE